MSAITLEIPEELAARLRPRAAQAPEILERGLRQVEAAGQPGYMDATEVLECLARLPGPDEILALRASPSLQRRVETLLNMKRDGNASPEQLRELEHYLYLDRLVRLAKAHAQRRLSEG